MKTSYPLNKLLVFSFFVIITFSNCKKDCKVVNADYDTVFLDHAGMAPERVRFSGKDVSADNYSWTVDGVTIEGNDQIVTFGVSGSYETSLIASKGSDQCSKAAIVDITPFPSVGSQRAISYFEEVVGDTSNLMTKVIDTESQNFMAISGLPGQGGGMDVDNSGKKIFGSPFALVASCFPNNEELSFPVKTSFNGIRKFFDLALDPDNGRVFFTVLDGNTFSIKSTDMYSGSMNIDNVYSETINAEFFYITNDRKDNILYWTDRGGTVIRKIENGINEPFINLDRWFVFGDIEFDDTNNRLYFVINSGNQAEIRSIKVSDFSGETVEVGPLVGTIPFMYLDEDRQELFWANDTERTISSKQISILGTTIHVQNLGPIKGLTVGFYGD